MQVSICILNQNGYIIILNSIKQLHRETQTNNENIHLTFMFAPSLVPCDICSEILKTSLSLPPKKQNSNI